jgi:hypothetical protein
MGYNDGQRKRPKWSLHRNAKRLSYSRTSCIEAKRVPTIWTKTVTTNFFLHLKEKLEECGFRQSMADQCLFISGKVICLVYADYTLLYTESMEDINVAIEAI